MSRPRLDLVRDPPGARDLVVIAHGGQDHSLAEPHDWRYTILRMWPFAAAAGRAAPHARVAILRYRYRGWNGPAAHPVADLRRTLSGVPAEVERIALVGHSMGGRAVVAVGAEDPRVVGVLGLAPWLPRDEPLTDLRGLRVVLAHGDEDRMTDPRTTAGFAARARRAGVRLALFEVRGDTHALLRRHGDWDELVRRFVRSTLTLDGGHDDSDDELWAATSADPAHGADPLPSWGRGRGLPGGVAGVLAARLRLRVP